MDKGQTSRRAFPWGFLAVALLLTGFGVLMVSSATLREDATGLGAEARAQLVWWSVAVAACLIMGRIPLAWLKELAVPGYIASLLVVLMMAALAGTALVPTIKGQANWIVLGPLRVQPVEFIKLTTLLTTALLLTAPGFDGRKFPHLLLALVIAGLPAALVAREDLGSALTFVPMAFGMLLVAGLRLRHLAILALATTLVAAVGYHRLPTEDSHAYQYRRIQAWLHPQEYALTEAYQTTRGISAIGSGQIAGKGWGLGDQNRLGMVPEKHTDMISAVIGEEFGFLGTVGLLLLYVAFVWTGLANASAARDPCGRLVIVGAVCLITGQAGINLSVATGLIPVTGVTLPFISYGGSSLLACWLAVGLSIASVRAR